MTGTILGMTWTLDGPGAAYFPDVELLVCATSTGSLAQGNLFDETGPEAEIEAFIGRYNPRAVVILVEGEMFDIPDSLSGLYHDTTILASGSGEAATIFIEGLVISAQIDPPVGSHVAMKSNNDESADPNVVRLHRL